ncbi:hypothetical protein [Empedobacter brevis]|uniref:hypothetical protein n=1 Tax=Empedobacter brevis TaxID=247 RepID=UPI0033402081
MMTINYDVVRIGKPRKDSNAERILHQNVKFLKFDIECFLENLELNDSHIIPITIVIPARGYNVLFDVRDIHHKEVRSSLSKQFKSRLFDRNRSILIDHLDNQIV